MRTPKAWTWRAGSLLVLLGGLTAGCRDVTAPPPSPEPDPLATVRYQIWSVDSYAGDGVVRFYWDATPFCDWPPCIPPSDIREVRVQVSTAGPDGPFFLAASSASVGPDSTVVDGLANGTLYYFRVASRDSLGQTIGISHVMETMPGPALASTARVPAFQRHYMSPSLAWSPDGNRLAFAKADGCVQENLYAYDFATTAIEQLTHFTRDEQLTTFAAWSADGNTIAFEYSPTLTAGWLDYRIWTLDLATGATHAVTSGRCDSYPEWGGAHEIFFVRYKESDRSREIYRVSLPGGEVSQITFNGRIAKGQLASRPTTRRSPTRAPIPRAGRSSSYRRREERTGGFSTGTIGRSPIRPGARMGRRSTSRRSAADTTRSGRSIWARRRCGRSPAPRLAAAFTARRRSIPAARVSPASGRGAARPTSSCTRSLRGQ